LVSRGLRRERERTEGERERERGEREQVDRMGDLEEFSGHLCDWRTRINQQGIFVSLSVDRTSCENVTNRLLS
jgi:hypothetical protein